MAPGSITSRRTSRCARFRVLRWTSWSWAADRRVRPPRSGASGRACALFCLSASMFPRHRPGETLPPGVEPIFAQLGVAEAIAAAGFTRHPGTWVTWSDPRRFDPFGRDSGGSWYGFQAPREQLDRILLDAVRRPPRSCASPVAPCIRSVIAAR